MFIECPPHRGALPSALQILPDGGLKTALLRGVDNHESHCTDAETETWGGLTRGTRKPEFMPRQADSRSEAFDLPGDPVVKILCFGCRGLQFNPWLGN